jgi:hypothetical protein
MLPILIPRGWTNKNRKTKDPWEYLQETFPATADYLELFKIKAQKRYDKGEYWWELRACDYYEEFEKPKIIYPNICMRPEFSYDEDELYTNQKCFIIPEGDKYLLGILNSCLSFFLFRSMLPKLRGGFYEPSYVYFKNFSIYKIDSSNSKENDIHVRIVNFVDSMLTLHKQLSETKSASQKEITQRQIDSTDKEIDRLVFELYGLSKDEIKIVEGETK